MFFLIVAKMCQFFKIWYWGVFSHQIQRYKICIFFPTFFIKCINLSFLLASVFRISVVVFPPYSCDYRPHEKVSISHLVLQCLMHRKALHIRRNIDSEDINGVEPALTAASKELGGSEEGFTESPMPYTVDQNGSAVLQDGMFAWHSPLPIDV